VKTKENMLGENKYRQDIDGLRAVAVLSVIMFHLGYLPNGYLGVDIFFVISGFLITGIIYREISENRFSIWDFYMRRTRRIIPLVTFVSAFSLAVGYRFMLPDDLENLAQSVIATNFFSNNILAVITTKNYWDVLNEYKPLMHTWSLGIEEQYYLLYPLIFMFIRRKMSVLIMPILLVLSLLSLLCFFVPSESFYKFYLLPYRFYELSIGGLLAILFKGKIIERKVSILLLIALVCLLCFDFVSIGEGVEIILVVLLTGVILVSRSEERSITGLILANKYVAFIGKLSFSLYMWHQVLSAFGRYLFFEDMTLGSGLSILILTFLFSFMTYFLVEQPFRKKSFISDKRLIGLLGLCFISTTAMSFHLYLKAGVVRDVPELDIDRNNIERSMHAEYNDRIYALDNSFSEEINVKILVIGNSHARDWANVLLESRYKDNIEISYRYNPDQVDSELAERMEKADIIFYSPYDSNDLNLPVEKIRCIGVKNFGVNNGRYYNAIRDENYCLQTTEIKAEVLQANNRLKTKWNDKYIDLIEYLVNDTGKMPIFTKDCKFISQDTEHLTRFGAQHVAQLFEHKDLFKMIMAK
jgi:peptidoglycan/LPS O-acetylase OafA/YrhL